MWKYLLLLLFPYLAYGQGTQITTVTADPPTCNTGMLYYNSTTNALKTCGPNNTWTPAGGASAAAISNNSWFFSQNCNGATNCTTVNWDAHAAAGATTTNASNVVTCPACNFTGTDLTGRAIAKVGQKFFAQDDTSDFFAANDCYVSVNVTFGGNATTTISSIDSATQIHVVGNSNTTSTAKACIAWGDDDTTAINTGVNAAPCGASYKFPGPNVNPPGASNILYSGAFFDAPIMQAPTNCAAIASSPEFLGPTMQGENIVGTIFIPTPDFTYTSIIGGDTANASTAKAAFGNFSMVQYKDFTIWGLGQQVTTMANTALIMLGSAARTYNVDALGWGGAAGGATFSCFSMNGTFDTFEQGGSIACGSIWLHVTGLATHPGAYVKNNLFEGTNVNFAGIGQCGVLIDASGSLYSENTQYNGCVYVNGEFTSVHSKIVSNQLGVTTDGACLYLGNSAIVNLVVGDRVCDTARTNQAGIAFTTLGGVATSNGVLTIDRALNLQGNGTGGVIFGGNSTNIIIDKGANVYNPQNSAAKWNGNGTFYGLTNSAASYSNTACATSQFALTSGWGTSSIASVSAHGNIQGCQVVITGASGSAGPVLTWTYPVAPVAAPGSCHLSGPSGTLTGVSSGVPGATTVAFTFTGTPSAQTYAFDVGCP